MLVLGMMVMMAKNNVLADAGAYRLGLVVMLRLLTVIPIPVCAFGKEVGVFVHETEVWWRTEATARMMHPTESVVEGREYVPM